MSDLSRVEQLLRNALGEDIYKVTPQSRVEVLLAQLNELIEGLDASVDPEAIAGIVTGWLAENIHDGAVVDSSLSVAGAAAESKKVGDELSDLKEGLDDKYTRYGEVQESGLALDWFSICPSLYTIVTYDNTNALQHGNMSGSGFTLLISKFKSEITDITFKLHYGAFATTPPVYINIACNANKAIAVSLNATSGNITLKTPTSSNVLSGVSRNSNCRSFAAGDILHLKKDGTKIAMYLVDNGIEVSVFENEWIDVLDLYGTSAGITADDVGFGLTTSNSARNEPLIYDGSYKGVKGEHFMPYDEVDARLTALEEGSVSNPYRVDLFMFMGQSNMAGRGIGSQAPAVIDGAGHEFRAISDPTQLHDITEPFGMDENVSGAIYDYLGGYKAKSGDMIPAFVNAYYQHTKTPIVGVSASEGGTQIAYWIHDTARYNDAVSRFNSAITWLTSNGYTIRHKYMLWCQGETNGDLGTSKADYISAFTSMANAWFTNGIEKIFLVKIGNYNGDQGYDYNTIMTAQNEICQTMENVVMVSTDFASMKDRGLMKDAFHYKQEAYNEVGRYAGINTALYVNTEKEPTMYDTQNGTLYYSHKN